MELETLPVEETDNEKDANCVETGENLETIEQKMQENNLQIDVMAVDDCQTAAVVQQPLVPDLTLFTYEVQQGYRIFRELLSDQYKSVTYPFIDPVDVDGLNLWDYHTRIETPMSFSQIETKFKDCLYRSITEIISDMRLILENCYRYNGSTHFISKLAQKLEKILDQKLALLNRSLREKVTLRATMAFRSGKEIVEDIDELGGRRRRSNRMPHVASAKENSVLMTHLLMEQEENERELKRLKDKEKKEANEALMQELNEWENKMFTHTILKLLRSMWEIPAIGSFLWLFHAGLNLPELNFTEFEHGLVLPHKSQQMAWIFTTLLVTPSQRKSLHKKLPMKFKVWERKLKERMDIWYLAKQDEQLGMVARQIGLNPTFFEILGETNPLETKSYTNLTLHQRVLILKVLCDECLDYHPQLRDYLDNTDIIPYSETNLGHDGENSTYIYFPIFDATDIRVYKQRQLAPLNDWCRKWTSTSNTVSGQHQTPKRTNQSRSRRSTPKSVKRSKESSGCTIEPGFELVCNDVESLRVLCEQFAELPPTPSRRKSGNRPTRKRSEKQLHKVLTELVGDLAQYDARFTRARVKGMLNLMRDWKSVEDASESGDEFNSKEGDVEEAAGESIHTPLDSEMSGIANITNTEEEQGEEATSLLSMVTRSRSQKRKFSCSEDVTSASSSSVSEFSSNLESQSISDTPVSQPEVSSEKRRHCDGVSQPSVFSQICDVIIFEVRNDVIAKLSKDGYVLVNGVDNNGQSGSILAQKGKLEGTFGGMGINESEADKVENCNGVSMDKIEQQPKKTHFKKIDPDGHDDVSMDIDKFGCEPDRACSADQKSSGYFPTRNGESKLHVVSKPNVDSYMIATDAEISHNFLKNCDLDACKKQGVGVEYMNGSVSGHEWTHSDNTDQCQEISDNSNDGAISLEYCTSTGIDSTRKCSTGCLPTGKRPTGTIPTVKEPTKMVPMEYVATGTGPTGMLPSEIVPTKNDPAKKDHTGTLPPEIVI